MKDRIKKDQPNKSRAAAHGRTGLSPDISSYHQLTDFRQETATQKQQQRMLTESTSAQLTSFGGQENPIQLTNWKSDGSKWSPADGNWDGVDYGLMPKESKPAGTTYDDATNQYTYLQAPQAAVVDASPAGQERAARIKPYLDLIGHLAGELDDDGAKGGHLLTAMQAKWGGKLEILNPGDAADGIWHARWKIDGKEKNGGSTMFPAGWTIDDLKAELNGSSTVGGKIVLKSGITIKKAGDTFYPEK